MLERFLYLGVDALRWQIGTSIFEAIPLAGARLMRWQCAGREILYWPGSVDTILEVPTTHGGNPILFPFPARCFDDGEPLCWRMPDGRQRPMPMHGLANTGLFVLDEADDRGFTATFCPDKEDHYCFPFDYRFSVEYRFEESELSCRLLLENRGHVPIPWSAGHHFYFSLPLVDGLSRSEHALRIFADRTATVGLHTNGRLENVNPFHREVTLDNPRLSAAITHFNLSSHEAVLFSRQRQPQTEIVIRHGNKDRIHPDFAFTTWSPMADAPFYCVEPWMGPSNAPEHRVGLHLVPPGESRSHIVEITIKRHSRPN